MPRETTDTEPKSYDFIHPGHKLNARWPMLDLVTGQTAGQFALELGARLQFPVKGLANASEHIKYRDFIDSLDSTTLVHEISLAPLSGVLWLCIDMSVVFALVDAYFGGHGRVIELEGPRLMSGTERRVLRHVLDACVKGLNEGWSQLIDTQPALVRFVQNERLGRACVEQILVDSQIVLSWLRSEASVRVVYPYAMLEPIGPKLERNLDVLPAGNDAFGASLGQELMHCEIDLHGVLGEVRVSLAQLLEMKPGDFIPLRDVQTVRFQTENVPLFDAKVGISNGQVSASLCGWHLRR